MKNIILAILILGSLTARADARPRKAFHCFYLVSDSGDVESACYPTEKKCGFFLRAFSKALRVQHPPLGCFISRETQEISIPRSCAKPLRAVFPNYASCLESYTAYVQSGESPTFCHPTESR